MELTGRSWVLVVVKFINATNDLIKLHAMIAIVQVCFFFLKLYGPAAHVVSLKLTTGGVPQVDEVW